MQLTANPSAMQPHFARYLIDWVLATLFTNSPNYIRPACLPATRTPQQNQYILRKRTSHVSAANEWVSAINFDYNWQRIRVNSSHVASSRLVGSAVQPSPPLPNMRHPAPSNKRRGWLITTRVRIMKPSVKLCQDIAMKCWLPFFAHFQKRGLKRE